MPDLLPPSPTPSPVSLQLPPATSPVTLLKPLNVLRDPKDGAFLERPDHLAGRHVCIVLYAIGNSRDERERAWRSREVDVSMKALGRAAKAIEDAGFNWRELVTHDDVLAAAQSLYVLGSTQ